MPEEDPAARARAALARKDELAENEAAELESLIDLILSFYDEWKQR